MLEKIVEKLPITPTTPNMAFLVLNEDKQTYTRYVSDEQGKVKKIQSSVNFENSDDIIAVKTDTGVKFSLNPNNQSVESIKTELNQTIENVKNTINSNLENKLEKDLSNFPEESKIKLQELVSTIKNETTLSSPILIRFATPVYIQVQEEHTIYLIISIESEESFSIKSIKLIRGEEQDYDVPFDEFIEEIFPLKQKEVDIKGNKMIGFMVKKEDNPNFFNSIIEADSVEVTVNIDNVDKVLFSFLDISEKTFMAKVLRGMERST